MKKQSIIAHSLALLCLFGTSIVWNAKIIACRSSYSHIQPGPPTAQDSLHWAAYTGDFARVKMLLASGHAPNEPGSPYPHRYTPLFYAALNGHATIVRHLLKAGATPTYCGPGPYKQTPLHAAALSGSTETITELLAADPTHLDAFDRKLRTPLAYAIFAGHREAVEKLLEAGANPNHSAEAITAEDDDYFEDRSDLGSCSLTSYAACLSRPQIIPLLHKAGADLEMFDGYCAGTALHWAVRGNRTAAVKTLLALGANPNSRDRNKDTPLHLAINMQCALAIIDMLLASGADFGAKNCQGETPLKFKVKEWLQLLERHLSDQNVIFDPSQEREKANAWLRSLQKHLFTRGFTSDELWEKATITQHQTFEKIGWAHQTYKALLEHSKGTVTNQLPTELATLIVSYATTGSPQPYKEKKQQKAAIKTSESQRLVKSDACHAKKPLHWLFKTIRSWKSLL